MANGEPGEIGESHLELWIDEGFVCHGKPTDVYRSAKRGRGQWILRGLSRRCFVEVVFAMANDDGLIRDAVVANVIEECLPWQTIQWYWVIEKVGGRHEIQCDYLGVVFAMANETNHL